MTEQGVTQPARRPCQERGDSLELALNGQDLRFVAGDAKLCFCCGSLDHLRNHIPSSTQQPFKGSSSSGSAPTSPSLLHTIRTCNENTILCAHTRKLVAIVKLVARAGILQLFDYIEKFVNGVFDLLHLGGVHETRYLGQLNGTDEHVAVSRLFGSASASLGVSMTSVGIACASAKLHALLAHVPAYDLEEESVVKLNLVEAANQLQVARLAPIVPKVPTAPSLGVVAASFDSVRRAGKSINGNSGVLSFEGICKHFATSSIARRCSVTLSLRRSTNKVVWIAFGSGGDLFAHTHGASASLALHGILWRLMQHQETRGESERMLKSMADESHHDGNQIAINAFRKFAADQSLSLRTEAFIPRKEVSATSLSLIQPFATHVKRNRWTRANNGDSRNRDNVSKSSAVSGHRRDQRSSHRNNGNRTKTSSNPRTSHHDGYHQRTINDRIRMQMQPQKHQLQHSDGRLFGPPTKRQDSAMSATLASQTPTPNPTAVSPGTIPFPPARASSYPRHSVPARSILKVQRQPDSLRRVTKSVQFKTGDQLEQVRRIEHVHDVMDRLPESPSDPAPTLSLFAQSHFDWEHAKGELAFAQSVVAREAKAWQDELASQQQVVSAKTNRNLELLHQLYVLKLRNLVKDKSGGVSS